MKNKTMIGIVFALAGGLCWGFSGSCGQFLFDVYKLDPIWLCSVRVFCAGLILLALSLIKCKKQVLAILKNKKDLLFTFLFGILGLLISQLCYLTAISYSNAATATVLQYLGPVMIMVFTCVWKKRAPNLAELFALILALGGTFLIATHGNIGELSISPLALVFGLLAALALVFYTLLPGGVIAKYGTLPVMGCGMTMGGIIFLPFAHPWTYGVRLDAAGVAAVVAIIIVGTVMAFSLYLMGVEYAGAVKASVVSSIEPVSAAVISALWLGSDFAPMDIVGFICVISAVIILSLFKGRAKQTIKEN